VVVSWTGEADVDLLVEEPGGTVCSLRNPRTTSGGVLLGDSYPLSSKNAAKTGGKTYSESYSCPVGFSGTYRVLVRKVWGKVTANKVTVDVYEHYGQRPGQKHERQQVPLDDSDSVVVFALDEGRRQEPLEEHQLANAVAAQVAIGQAQAVLAQNLDNITDPR